MEIANLTPDKIKLSFLKKSADKAVKVLGQKGLENISLVFVCDARMRQINKKYRGKNAVTDVLSFEDLNEIYICLPQAKRQTCLDSKIKSPIPARRRGEEQAKALKCSINSELTRLLTHGIVHLKGYDHEKSASEAEKMRQIEEKILKSP